MLDSICSTAPSELSKNKTPNTVKTNTGNYAYAPDWLTGGAGVPGVGDSIILNNNTQSVTAASNGELSTAVQTNELTVGTNDGKLTFGEKVGNFLLGAGKTIVNTVKDIVTDPKKALLAVGTAALCIACPPAGVALGVAGVATGLYSGYKAYQQYDAATTEEGKKLALQGMGGSTLQTVVSAVGVKGSLGAMKATTGSAMAEFANSGSKSLSGGVKAFLKDTVTGGRGAGGPGYQSTQFLAGLKSGIKSNGGIKGTVSNGLSHAGDAMKNAHMPKVGEVVAKIPKHPIKGMTTKVGSFIENSNYSSTFGALSAPLGNEMSKSNQIHQGIPSGIAAGMEQYGDYTYSQDWMEYV